MNRNFGIGVLILVLGLSSVHAALAVQIVDSSPIIVQPYDWSEISQQMLNRDRQNRDEEIAIRGLIEENNKLTQDTLARQEDEGLKKINQIMLSYQSALLSRDQARIAANGERWRTSRYGDLIALTEDVDGLKGVGQTLQLKSDAIEAKYKILADLKDEMMALNEKLKGEAVHEKLYKTAPQQKDKIQVLTKKLGEMDQKIARYDEILAKKDQQITQLNESIRWLKQVLAAAKNKAEYYQLTSVFLENQITAMQADIQSGQKTQAQADALRRQLAEQQNKVDLLKQELESKITESNKMTLMMEDYQKKLESKNNAYNEQWGQLLSFKNDQARMEAQIGDLNTRLQEKEARIVNITKDMYDFQELTRVKDRDLQAKDLSLSMIQQKMMDEKIQEIKSLRIELALARQQLGGMPNSDEIDFLRTGLSQATAQLKQKDAMLALVKANADEYEKEFKEQSKEFQSVKEQLQSAYEEINHKNEDLKYKDMTIIRLKERFAIHGEPDENNQGDRLREKLKQALDKMDEQGRLINILVRKLQECGQSVNLTPHRSSLSKDL